MPTVTTCLNSSGRSSRERFSLGTAKRTHVAGLKIKSARATRRSIFFSLNREWPCRSENLACLKAVQHIDHLPQTSIIATIEAESHARQIEVSVVFAFFRRRLDQLHFFPHHDVRE